MNYDDKTEKLLDHCGDFEGRDFEAAAYAFLDQAGLPLAAQAQVEALVRAAMAAKINPAVRLGQSGAWHRLSAYEQRGGRDYTHAACGRFAFSSVCYEDRITCVVDCAQCLKRESPKAA